MDEVEWNCTECGEYFEALDSEYPVMCPICGNYETEKTGE